MEHKTILSRIPGLDIVDNFRKRVLDWTFGKAEQQPKWMLILRLAAAKTLGFLVGFLLVGAIVLSIFGAFGLIGTILYLLAIGFTIKYFSEKRLPGMEREVPPEVHRASTLVGAMFSAIVVAIIGGYLQRLVGAVSSLLNIPNMYPVLESAVENMFVVTSQIEPLGFTLLSASGVFTIMIASETLADIVEALYQDFFKKKE